MPVVIFSLLIVLFGSIAAEAGDVALDERLFRHAWYDEDGEVVKDSEWRVTGTISTSDNAVRIRIDEQKSKYADNFASVMGEMDFAEDALRSTEVTFADGTSRSEAGPFVTLEGANANQAISKIVAHFSLVGFEWTLEWDGAALQPAAVLPADWIAATSDATRDGSPGSQLSRGTWLTPTGIVDRPQDLTGFWKASHPPADGGDMDLFEEKGDAPIGRSLSEKVGEYIDLARSPDANRWKGDGAAPGVDGFGFHTCPLPAGLCPQLCKWSAAFLDTPPGALHITGQWAG